MSSYCMDLISLRQPAVPETMLPHLWKVGFGKRRQNWTGNRTDKSHIQVIWVTEDPGDYSLWVPIKRNDASRCPVASKFFLNSFWE